MATDGIPEMVWRYRFLERDRHEHAENMAHEHEGGRVEHDHKQIDYYVSAESFEGDGKRHIHEATILRWGDQ